MLSVNRAKLCARIGLATVWAGLLVVVGVSALLTHTPAFGVARLLPVVGWTSIAAGQIVFGGLVADRLFPHADGRVTGTVELVCGAVFLVGIASLLILWLGSA